MQHQSFTRKTRTQYSTNTRKVRREQKSVSNLRELHDCGVVECDGMCDIL